MSGLTVREKDHWKERITRKIDQAIEALYSKNDPTFLEQIREKARTQAIESLGLTKFDESVKKADEQIKSLETEKNEAYRNMLAIVKGVSVMHVGHYSRPHDVEAAIGRRKTVHEKELLSADPLGRQILALQQEKEELLDTVWLATSSKHIKELWQHVSNLLGQKPTNLQKQAINIEPVTTD